MPKLSGRVALITGSSQGMGAGIARRLHAEGARVMLQGLEEDSGRQLARELSGSDAPSTENAAFCGGDLRDEDTCRLLVERTVENFGALDILVNSAGDTSRGTLADTSVALWDRIFAVNVRAPFLLIQHALPYLKRSAQPAIVNIGSINAYIGEPKLMAYSASKGALMTLTRNIAAALARDRIRVNLINPGWTLTEGEDRVKRDVEHKPDWLREAVAMRPFGRLLSPDDIARVVLFFCCEDSDTITGSVVDYEQYPVGAPPNW